MFAYNYVASNCTSMKEPPKLPSLFESAKRDIQAKMATKYKIKKNCPNYCFSVQKRTGSADIKMIYVDVNSRIISFIFLLWACFCQLKCFLFVWYVYEMITRWVNNALKLTYKAFYIIYMFKLHIECNSGNFFKFYFLLPFFACISLFADSNIINIWT